MGTVDIRIKNFFKINTVFAQLFSRAFFGGKLEIVESIPADGTGKI